MGDEWEDYLQQPPTRHGAGDHIPHTETETMDHIEQALAAMPPVKVQGIGDGTVLHALGVVRAVLAGLRDQGITVGSWQEVFSVTVMILDLIQQLGPQIEAIIEAVKKALGK